MNRLKNILFKIMLPNGIILSVLAAVSIILLIYAFAFENPNPFLTYISYFLSAYVLAAVCFKAPALFKKAKRFRHENKYVVRYTETPSLRIKISLYISFWMNALYTLLQLFLGIRNHSLWFYALAGYYAILGVARFFLLKESRFDRMGENTFHEYLIYRFCGMLLIILNIALSVIVTYIVWQNRGFQHHYILTIAMAVYTFYSLTKSIVDIKRYRKYESPLMSAVKAIGFASALVSLLSLETAMLSAFGKPGQDSFRQTITAATGAAVCALVLLLAIIMVVRSTKEIQKLKKVTDNGK